MFASDSEEWEDMDWAISDSIKEQEKKVIDFNNLGEFSKIRRTKPILKRLLDYLDYSSVGNLRLTCRAFNNILSDKGGMGEFYFQIWEENQNALDSEKRVEAYLSLLKAIIMGYKQLNGLNLKEIFQKTKKKQSALLYDGEKLFKLTNEKSQKEAVMCYFSAALWGNTQALEKLLLLIKPDRYKKMEITVRLSALKNLFLLMPIHKAEMDKINLRYYAKGTFFIAFFNEFTREFYHASEEKRFVEYYKKNKDGFEHCLHSTRQF